MHTSILSFAALASTLVAAIPMDPIHIVYKAPKVGEKFSVEVVGHGIVDKYLTASKSRIFVGGTQKPSCHGGEREDFASFVLNKDSSINLYKTDLPAQELWVDASGMGGGIVGYTTGVEPIPSKASRTGFKVDPRTRLLTFNGVGGKACPTGEDQKWSLWFTDNEKPGQQDGCVSVKLKAYETDYNISCQYSEAQ